MRPVAAESARRSLAWRVFLTCWLIYSVFWTPYVVREHFPAITLAERGTLNVESYVGWSNDIFTGPRGGAYINNNPGASLTAAIPLWLLKPVLDRVDRWNQTLPPIAAGGGDGELFWRTLAANRAFYFLLVACSTVVLVMAPATAGTAAYLCCRLIDSGLPGSTAAWVSMIYGLGTPVLFRTAHLNHNLLAGDAGFFAFLILWDPQDRPLSRARTVLAGLLAGYAVLCDFSGLVILATVGLYVCLRSRGRRVLALTEFAAGAVPGVAALAIYQAWAFGSFYHPSQQYMTPTAPTSQGYRGFSWPSPRLMWANFFDPRFGLFAYSPALLLAFAAPFLKRVRYRIPRREALILWIYFVLFVLFCSANRYSWLQPLTGFRYLVPVVPALALLAMETAQALPAWLRWTVGVAACAQSLVLAAAHENDVRLAAVTLWRRRLVPFWMIRLRDGGVPVNGYWAAALFLGVLAAIAMIWRARAESYPQSP